MIEAILYNIRSLHNVGSIFRTADGAGISKLYLCGITPTPLDRFGNKRLELSKTALGAEDFIEWEKIGNSHSPQKTIYLIKNLKKKGYSVLAIEQNKRSISYTKLNTKNHKSKIALIVGDEVKGIPQSILKNCDQVLEIPMKGKKESLNVSVAFGVAVYEITNKLDKTK
ncbi:MAG TPA: TrmH family RNA methyltransferase [Candidatus Paceibacterota bacterium]|nr:TrmH family RNA methyltransferase [Candidatus Paceibacterota bacterium]